MRHGSLFSGIGGFDLAAEWMGWTNVFHCEWNDFGQRVLKYYWPEAISYGDITKTDFTVHRGYIDILTGGFPCQPYSMAGKRKGKEDERHLWPEMLRAIREIKPTWVVGENVFGITNWDGGVVFNEVQTDLEAEGYEVQPYVLPACAVNAPHRRDRVWFVAHAVNSGHNTRRRTTEETYRIQSKCGEALDTGEFNRAGISSASPDTEGTRAGENIRGIRGVYNGCGEGVQDAGVIANTSNQGLEGSEINRSIRGIGTERDKQSARCVCPDWQNFPTISPLCGGDDGLPNNLVGITFSKWRNESIKAMGNAIVPQVALQIFKAIEQYELKTTEP